MADKKQIIHSTYLALGSVALFISLSHLGSYAWASKELSPNLTEYAIKLLIFFIISLVAGILLIISYYGFLHSKKYQFTGIVGCISFVVYFVYSSEHIKYIDFKHPLMYISRTSTMLASIIVLILSLVFWRKLEEKK